MTMTAMALVFSRTAGFVFRAPGFSHQAVPHALRAAIAFSLTLLLAPTIHNVQMNNLALVLSLISEFAIGATIGYAASVLPMGLDAGGQALDDFVGIRGVNPTAGPFSGVGFGKLWSFLFIASYFMLGGYSLPLIVFANGLHTVPPGAIIDPKQWQVFVFQFPSLILEAAFLIAGPALVIGMLTQFALSSIARIVPKFSVQSLTFGVTFAVVLFITLVNLPLMIGRAGHIWMPLPLPGITPAKSP